MLFFLLINSNNFAVNQKALRGGRGGFMEKELKNQIKKDKARLKELRKRNKRGLLTEEETWEYVRLLNAETDRRWKLTDKLQIVTFILMGLTGILLIVKLVLLLVLY